MNDTLRNHSLSAKNKFSILLKLMKNNKFSNIPPLVENNITVQDPLEQSNIFNKHFAEKLLFQMKMTQSRFYKGKMVLVTLVHLTPHPLKL